MSNLSRRMLVSGAAALPALAVPALAVPAVATADQAAPDNELRRLWSDYLGRVAEYEAICEKHSSARAAFEAEMPPCPDGVVEGVHWAAKQSLRDKHGLDPLYDAWNEAHEGVSEIVTAIQQTQAESLFGVGVKLTAIEMQHEEWDLRRATQATLTDIDRLIGGDFSRASARIEQHSMGAV
jgi:hypothetical protein